MEGWIKIHRQIKDHWIWDDPAYLKAWLGILLSVNHEDKKILIQGELIECKRGQSILSLAGWVKCFGKRWTMQKVRTFFELLKRDEMITTEGLRKTTRLTVCKYDDYQIIEQAKNKQRTSRQQGDNKETTTNKNEEEGIKNEKNEEGELTLKSEVWQFIDQYPEPLLKAFLNYWTEKDAKGKMRFQSEKYFEVSRRLATWASRDKTFNKQSELITPVFQPGPER